MIGGDRGHTADGTRRLQLSREPERGRLVPVFFLPLPLPLPYYLSMTFGV